MKCEKMQWNTYLILKITYKTYKELLKINNKKANNPVFNISKNLNRLLTKEDTQMANKPMKRCCTSLIVRRKQIKTTIQTTLKNLSCLSWNWYISTVCKKKLWVCFLNYPFKDFNILCLYRFLHSRYWQFLFPFFS